MKQAVLLWTFGLNLSPKGLYVVGGGGGLKIRDS